MKLLLCRWCGDVFSLNLEVKSCSCGQVQGKYLPDKLNAVYTGTTAIPLGFANSSFNASVKNQPEEGPGREFTAFVIEKDCPTFKRKKCLK